MQKLSSENVMTFLLLCAISVSCKAKDSDSNFAQADAQGKQAAAQPLAMKKDLFEILEDEPGFTMTYAALPLKGDSAKRPWPSMHWAYREFGIARRSDVENVVGYSETDKKYSYLDTYRRTKVTPPGVFTLQEIASMTASRLASLSPAEKFDLASGARDFPLFRSVVKTTLDLERNQAQDDWQGYTMANCIVSTIYDQPVEMVSRKGTGDLLVQFTARDIEGLLAWRTNKVLSSIERHRLGEPNKSRRLDGGKLKTDDERIDAATFHAVLTNMFSKANRNKDGSSKRWLAADVDERYPDRSRTVWGFQSVLLPNAEAQAIAKEAQLNVADIFAPDADDPESKIVCLKTRLYLSLESSNLASNDPVPREWRDVGTNWDLNYCLRISGKGQLAAGVWLQEYNLVDTLWSFGRPPAFTAKETLLESLYKKSARVPLQ